MLISNKKNPTKSKSTTASMISLPPILLLSLILTSLLLNTGTVSSFVVQRQQKQQSQSQLNGIFDQMKKSMESGYAGGDDSPYSKIKEADRKKEEIRKKKAMERKSRGYSELKDVKKKSFVKMKYDLDKDGNVLEVDYGKNKNKKQQGGNDDEGGNKKKKLFGLF